MNLLAEIQVLLSCQVVSDFNLEKKRYDYGFSLGTGIRV